MRLAGEGASVSGENLALTQRSGTIHQLSLKQIRQLSWPLIAEAGSPSPVLVSSKDRYYVSQRALLVFP
jgi:hypothetical protein